MSENTFNFKGYDLPERLVNLTGGGPDSFDAISTAHIADLRRYLGIKSDSRLLEIGCGIGRDAIPLTEIITEGRYDGVDIIGDSIAWLSANLTPRHPNFNFHHYNVADQLHNPTGTEDMRSFKMPLEDNSVDGVFAWSVFTHMLSDYITYYLGEFQRVLKPGGRAFLTCFLYNDAVLAKARETNLTPFDLRFEHPWGEGCLINDPQHPLGAVAYNEERLKALVGASGLTLERIALGSWSGYWPYPEGGQDALIISKA